MKASTVFAAALLLASFALVAACSFLRPSKAVDVAKIAICVWDHWDRPVPEIMQTCERENEAEVVDLLSARKLAIAHATEETRAQPGPSARPAAGAAPP